MSLDRTARDRRPPRRRRPSTSPALHGALAEAISTARSASIGSAGRCTRPTPASTRSCRWWSSFPATEADVVGRGRGPAAGSACRSRRGAAGTSQAGQSIGPGVILDCSKHFNRVLEINADGALGPRRAGLRARRPEPRAQAARPAVRPRHLDLQPGHDRRHDRQQLLGRPLGHLRQDDRPCARAEGRPGRRQPSSRSGRSTSRSSRPSARQQDLEGRVLPRRPAAGRRARRRDRPPVPEDPPPRRRLQPRRLRPDGAIGSDDRSTSPTCSSARRGRSACRSRRSCGWSSCRAAKAVLVVAVRRPARRPGGDPGHPAASARGRRGGRPVRARQHQAQPRGDPAPRLPPRRPRRDPARSSSTATTPTSCRRGSTRWKPTCAGAASAITCSRATDAAAQARIWKLRTLALGLSMAEKGDAKAISFVEDTAVAPEHLRDYIAEFLAIIARHGTKAGVYAHASVGCLHVRPVINLKTEEGVRQFEAIAEEVADLVLKYGGALSGEHGDGLVRSPFQEKMFGPVLYQAFRELKRTFDPHEPAQPRQDRRRAAADDEPALRPGVRHARRADDVRLLGRRRPAAGRRAVRGRRRLPQEARGDDVPVVPGDPRRAATAPAAGPTRCGWRSPASSAFEGLTDPARPRGARPLPRVQGVQGRVPDQRRHGPAQGRVPAPVSPRARPAAAQPRLRPRRARSAGWGSRLAPAVELAGAEPARSAG